MSDLEQQAADRLGVSRATLDRMSNTELERAAREAHARAPKLTDDPFPGLDLTGMPEDLGQAERRAVLGVLPRKSLWPELEEYNQRAAELQGRQFDVEHRLRALHEQRVNAPSADAQAAADWEFAGRTGPRPESSIDRIDAEITDAERERDGLLAAIDRALEDRGRFVEKNRDRLANVAAQQANTVLNRIVELLDEAEQARATLGELRQAEIWARLFPSELANREPQTRLFGGGLRHVSQPVGITAQIDYARMIDALRADATWLRNAAATNEQRALLEGRDPRSSRGAKWADTDEYKAERRAEIDEAVQAFVQEWGYQPTEAQLIAFIDSRNPKVA
jgi:hypothetical protein